MANPNWHKGMPSPNPTLNTDPSIVRRRGKNAPRNLLSKAYKSILGNQVPEDLKQAMGLEDGSTFADAIGMNVVKRALGAVPDDKICFRAITELRETTEGKTPEKVIAAGTNVELQNLAAIIASGPADTEAADQNVEDDKQTEDSEAAFHEGVDDGA